MTNTLFWGFCLVVFRKSGTLQPSAFTSDTMLFIQMRILNKKVTSLGQGSLFAQQELYTLFKLLNSISVA